MWSLFDSVEVITVPDSTRLPKLLENLESSHFNMKYVTINTFERVKTNEKKNYSIFKVPFVKDNSCCDNICEDTGKHHLDIIKKKYKNPLINRILILEDDARFELPLNTKKIKKILNWLKHNKEWDILYFGSLPFLAYPVNNYILKTYKPYLIHCYCVNRSGMKKILQHCRYEGGSVMDVQFANISKLEKYAVYPSINNQESPGDYAKSKISKYVKFRRITFIVENLFYLFITIFLILIIIVCVCTTLKKKS